jgi:8-oxo-dGTP pyrophosphatase MutT (NUDIX family)
MNATAGEPQAAVAIVCAREPEESVLLLRRTARADDPWSGHWSFPGGRCEPGDPDLLHTALRELQEECGICLSRECLQAQLQPLPARRSPGPFVLVAPFLFSVEERLPTLPDPREVAGTRWIEKRLLCDPAQHALRRVPCQPGELRFPAIALDDMPLWGFTYRLITDWLGLIPKPCPREEAGFERASRLLDFLTSQGLKLKQGWTERQAPPGTAAGERVHAAVVEGVIPVNLVLERFAAPEDRAPRVNLLEVQPDHIRVAGLAYEEYLISAMPPLETMLQPRNPRD